MERPFRKVGLVYKKVQIVVRRQRFPKEKIHDRIRDKVRIHRYINIIVYYKHQKILSTTSFYCTHIIVKNTGLEKLPKNKYISKKF